ncbi:unnamed protein product [Caretta caretta]
MGDHQQSTYRSEDTANRMLEMPISVTVCQIYALIRVTLCACVYTYTYILSTCCNQIHYDFSRKHLNKTQTCLPLSRDQSWIKKQDTFYLSINHQELTQRPVNGTCAHTQHEKGNSESSERRKGQDKCKNCPGVTSPQSKVMWEAKRRWSVHFQRDVNKMGKPRHREGEWLA